MMYKLMNRKKQLVLMKVRNWMAAWKNRTSRYISFSAHHTMVFYFWCSVYWWKGSVRF